MLKSKFEEIRMKDDKKFDEFYAQLNDIANTSFNLGEKIVENKIVKNKILRSLSKVFRPKVTTIKKSKDVDVMRVKKIVGSFQTYELSLPQPKKKILAKVLRKRRSLLLSPLMRILLILRMLTRKIHKFLRTSKGSSRTSSVDSSKR
jgi:hypothetical protein